MSSSPVPPGKPSPATPPNPGNETPPARQSQTSKAAAPADLPLTQNPRAVRDVPAWRKRWPRIRPLPASAEFSLVDRATVDSLLPISVTPEIRARIHKDLELLEEPLLRLFRDRDREAYIQQNRHRMFQIAFIMLAVAATFFGALLALSLDRNPQIAAAFGFVETIIAASTAFLANQITNRPPQQLWLQNRLRAEYLRREYFRFLMNLEPYTSIEGVERRRTLEMRAASINMGDFPETPTELETGAKIAPQGG